MKWKEIVDRWHSPTPAFWEKVKTKGAYLGSLGTGVATVQAQFPKLHIPELIFTISSHCAVAGFIMVLLAKLTCDDSNQSFIGDEKEAIDKGRNSVG